MDWKKWRKWSTQSVIHHTGLSSISSFAYGHKGEREQGQAQPAINKKFPVFLGEKMADLQPALGAICGELGALSRWSTVPAWTYLRIQSLSLSEGIENSTLFTLLPSSFLNVMGVFLQSQSDCWVLRCSAFYAAELFFARSAILQKGKRIILVSRLGYRAPLSFCVICCHRFAGGGSFQVSMSVLPEKYELPLVHVFICSKAVNINY